MPRLETFDIRIHTGARGNAGTPHYIINGFPIEFESHSGSTEPGCEFEAHGNPGSYPHSLLLSGPESGSWDIEQVTITYHHHLEEPYTVRLGQCTLDDDSDLSIYHPRPLPVFSV